MTHHPPFNDPFKDPPKPDLSDALPCTCGQRPDWDGRGTSPGLPWNEFRLLCHKAQHIQGPWERSLQAAIRAWNDEVVEGP
jgi:hypothetical protein